MLGDNPEKFKNPLKKAMRRRNAKTVAFAEPTYFPVSDNGYSSEEENEEDLDFITTALDAKEVHSDETAETGVHTVEPLKIRDAPRENGTVEPSSSNQITIPHSSDTINSQGDGFRTSAEAVGLQGTSADPAVS